MMTAARGKAEVRRVWEGDCLLVAATRMAKPFGRKLWVGKGRMGSRSNKKPHEYASRCGTWKTQTRVSS